MQIKMVQCTCDCHAGQIDMIARGDDGEEYTIAAVQHGQLFVNRIGYEVARKLGLLVDDDGYLKVSRMGPLER